MKPKHIHYLKKDQRLLRAIRQGGCIQYGFNAGVVYRSINDFVQDKNVEHRYLPNPMPIMSNKITRAGKGSADKSGSNLT